MPVDTIPSDDFKLESVIIDRLQLSVIESLSKAYPMVAQNMTVERLADLYAERVVYAFMSYLANVHRDDKETITIYEYPATAWDFLKEKYAPKWLLKRWPVLYAKKEVVVYSTQNFMCPHLPTEPTYPHAMWLKMNQDTSWWDG